MYGLQVTPIGLGAKIEFFLEKFLGFLENNN